MSERNLGTRWAAAAILVVAALSATVLLAPAAEAGSITLCGSGGCSTHYRGTLPIGDHCVNTTGSGDPCGGSAPAVK